MQNARPDMILLDLFMPVMDGTEVIARMKGDAALRSIPIIAITGGVMDPDKNSILEGFGIPSLAKPWREDDLFDRIEAAFVGRSRQESIEGHG